MRSIMTGVRRWVSRFLGTVIVISLLEIGFVLFNGVGDDYELFDSGIVLSGWAQIGAALAILGGSLAAGASSGEVVTADPHGHPTVTRAYNPVAIVVAVVLFGIAGFVCVQGTSSRFVDDVAAGDCFDDPAKAQVDLIVVIPCDEPHDIEVYAVMSLSAGADAPFPGDEAIFREADELCFAPFEDYVDVSYFDSILDILYFYPTPESWEMGDRGVICALARVDLAKMTGSMMGTGQ